MKKLIRLICITAAILGASLTVRAASPWVVNTTSATGNVPVTFNQPVTFNSTTSGIGTDISTNTPVANGTNLGVFYQSGGLVTNGNGLTFDGTNLVGAGNGQFASGTVTGSVVSSTNRFTGLGGIQTVGTINAGVGAGGAVFFSTSTDGTGANFVMNSAGNIAFNSPAGSTFNVGKTSMTTGGVITSSHTEIETTAEAAGASDEHDGSRYDANYTAVGINTLFSGWRWESQYDISGSTATGTQHGVVGFFEQNAARNNWYFSAATESSVKAFVSSTAPATAVPICHIDHAKVWNDLNVTQPWPVEAWHPRIDFFNGSNESVAFSTHTFGYFIFPEFFRLNQAYSSNVWGWYNATDKSIQNVNAGNVFKVSITTQVDNGATLDLSQACGGRLIMTSTTSIMLSASKFANTIGTVAPSSSTLAVPYLTDCQVELVNGNLNGRTITIKDTSDYTPIIPGDELLRASGGETQVWAFGTAAQWVESKGATSMPTVIDAYNTSFGSVTAASTSTLTWTLTIDRNTEFTASSTFTAVAPGLYEINAQANASQTAGQGCLLIKKNNVTVTGANVCATGATALATVLGIVDDRILTLAAGDTVYVAGSATTANVTFQNMTLTIRRIP